LILVLAFNRRNRVHTGKGTNRPRMPDTQCGQVRIGAACRGIARLDQTANQNVGLMSGGETSSSNRLGLVRCVDDSVCLACLPNSQMTAAEMACCKKMAGACHMGMGQHPCCKTFSPAPSPVASVQAAGSHAHPGFAVEAVTTIFEVVPVSAVPR